MEQEGLVFDPFLFEGGIIMANIQERRNKDGKLISYSIRVHRGRGADGKQLKPWTATFEVSPNLDGKECKKKAEAFAATFEKECREGVASDSRQKFSAYCDYVIAMKERTGVKHSTIVRYKELTGRIYPRNRPHETEGHSPRSPEQLVCPARQAGKRKHPGNGKVDLAALLKEKHLTRQALADMSGASADHLCGSQGGTCERRCSGAHISGT